LKACPPDNVFKMSDIVRTIRSVTKNFKKELPSEFVPLFKEVIESLVPLLGTYTTH